MRSSSMNIFWLPIREMNSVKRKCTRLTTTNKHTQQQFFHGTRCDISICHVIQKKIVIHKIYLSHSSTYQILWSVHLRCNCRYFWIKPTTTAGPFWTLSILGEDQCDPPPVYPMQGIERGWILVHRLRAKKVFFVQPAAPVAPDIAKWCLMTSSAHLVRLG